MSNDILDYLKWKHKKTKYDKCNKCGKKDELEKIDNQYWCWDCLIRFTGCY